jgi:hypothetical protein
MSEAKTVQKIIRPITVRCGTAGCTAKAEAVASTSDEGDDEIIAPRGWSFAKKNPQSTRDVVYGLCPQHAKS